MKYKIYMNANGPKPIKGYRNSVRAMLGAQRVYGEELDWNVSEDTPDMLEGSTMTDRHVVATIKREES